MDEKKEVIGGVMFGEVLPPKGRALSSTAARPRREAKAISTDLQVKSAKPSVHRVTGAVGLYLQIGETGSASWFFRFRLGDKRHEMGFGSCAKVSLADARKKARAADALRDEGVNPIEARKRARAENIAKFRAEARSAFTFEQMVERFLDLNAPGWKGNYARANWLGSIKLHAYPVIGDVGLDQITVEHAFAVIDKAMAKAGKPTARRLRSKCEQVIDMARARGLRNRDLINPFDAKLIKLPKQRGDRPHYRSVNFDDAQDVFQRLKAFVEQHSAIAVWLFMILTAARPSEALHARWGEIDWAKRLWIVPPPRMKGAREHRVPLSPTALWLLERQVLVRTGDLIFPFRGGSPISYDAFASKPAHLGIDAASPHGWRSTFKDYCGDIAENVPRDLAEAALAHSLGGVEGAYRKLTAVEKRRAVMESYAAWLMSDDRKVVALSDHRTLSTSKRA